jgi:hypothetical protein
MRMKCLLLRARAAGMQGMWGGQGELSVILRVLNAPW